jgi:cell division protein FtsQ
MRPKMPRSSRAKPSLPDASNIDAFMRKRVVVIGAAMAAMLVAAVAAWFAISAMTRDETASDARPTSPLLPIRDMTFVGSVGALQRVDQGELKRIAGAIQNMGGSMLRTDLNQVRAAVMEVEWVRDAEVRRRFPATLEVRIEEHVPYARWRRADETEAELLVNTAGEIFAADFVDESTLPILSGPKDSARDVLIQYLAFNTQLAAIGDAPAELTLSPRRAWQLKLGNGATLLLGRSDAGERLARYVRAYPSIAAVRTAGARVDLRYPGGLAVRAGASPSAAKS